MLTYCVLSLHSPLPLLLGTLLEPSFTPDESEEGVRRLGRLLEANLSFLSGENRERNAKKIAAEARVCIGEITKRKLMYVCIRTWLILILKGRCLCSDATRGIH